VREYYKDYSRYYVGGSAAPKIDFEKSYEEKVKVAPKVNLRRKQLVALQLKMMSFMVISFMCAGILVFQHSAMAYNRAQINTKEKAIAELEDRIDSIKTDIAESVDAKYVEKRAVEKLGMVRPKKHQIVYIEVPKESYVVQYN
jgi:cell division protein FtsB